MGGDKRMLIVYFKVIKLCGKHEDLLNYINVHFFCRINIKPLAFFYQFAKSIWTSKSPPSSKTTTVFSTPK